VKEPLENFLKHRSVGLHGVEGLCSITWNNIGILHRFFDVFFLHHLVSPECLRWVEPNLVLIWKKAHRLLIKSFLPNPQLYRARYEVNV
jgi:hypothetical protein